MNKFHNYRALIIEQNKLLNEDFFEEHIEILLNKRSSCYDKILQDLWVKFGLNKIKDLSLNAVGGYGRKIIHPKSDLDVAILSTRPLTQDLQAKLSNFVTALWDLGLDIGHSVRTIKEAIRASKNDVTIETNNVDIRCISGTPEHEKQLLRAIYSSQISTREEFYRKKVQEQLERHSKCKNTALFLEPNIKNNPGGMRDMQNIFWIAQKLFKVKEPTTLVSIGILNRDELQELVESYDFVCRIRWALHCVAERPMEILTFEYQIKVAEFMKFGRGERAHFAVEKMMRQLYRAMTRIRELNQMILGLLKSGLSQLKPATVSIEIDDQFCIENDLIKAKYDEVFYDKGNVIKLFRHMAGIPEIIDIAPTTLRLLRNTRRSLLGELQDYQVCRHHFIKILQSDHGLNKTFSLMHRYGILAAYFPEWRAMEGQMQFDIHNAYTLDEHAFRLVQNINDLWIGKQSFSLPQIIFDDKKLRDVLIVTGLCHDLNGTNNVDSHHLSALVAQDFAELHEFSKEQCKLIRWLIENQSLLLETVQTRDITDPKIIDQLAKSIKNKTRLDTLYSFTAADLMATNDSAWNEWIESLLERLYKSIELALTNGAEGVYEHRNIIKENKAASLRTLIGRGMKEELVNKLWSELPPKFFRINQQKQIVELTEKLLEHSGYSDYVKLTDDTVLECSNLVVITKDRDGLFSDLFTTLSALKISVKDAQLYKLRNGFVLEVIKILEYNNSPAFGKQRAEHIKTKVMSVLSEKNPPTTCKPLSKYDSFSSTPEIEFLDSGDSENEVLKVNTVNNPLLIGDICQVFYEEDITIHTARITTLGESCENVFSISDSSHGKLCELKKTTIESRLFKKLA